MEALVKSSKRKKRKTRRSLNEIKKRCDRAMKSIVSEVPSIPTKSIPLQHISCNRITLLNKVIQSKTVLRSQVLNSVNNKVCVKNKCNIAKPQKCPINLQNNSYEENIVSSKSETDEFNNLENDVHSVKSAVHSTKNPVFLSSTSSKEPSPSIKTGLSPHFQESCNLYDEFVNNIPNYLKESAPQLLFENDIMKNNKVTLHKIKMDMHVMKKHNEVFGIKCFSIPAKEKTFYKNLVGSPSISLSPESPLHLDIESTSNSSKSNLSKPNSTQSICSNNSISNHYYLPLRQNLKQDSPEHQYYPHRLNE